jgi:threonine dehydratase
MYSKMSKSYILRNLIDKASTRIYDLAKKTELNKANNISRKLKNNIYFKREDQQPVFSFKLRGAYNKILEVKDLIKENQEIYACSAGNHAQGVALSGSHLNIPTNIIMPTFTPEIKIDNVKNFGGNVILHGDSFDEAKIECDRLVEENNGILVHPFDDLDIIAGQGTIGKELIEEIKDIDYVFCPIGGGGIAAGVSSYIKETNPSIKVIGIETFDSNSMYLSRIKGDLQLLENTGLFSDGTAVKIVGQHTFEICNKYLDDIILVDTDDICLAIKDIYDDTRSIMEPAGALGLAGLKKYVTKYNLTDKKLVAILSGANMDFNKLRFISDRTGIKSDKEAMLYISIPEKPGTFLEMYQQIYPRNVLEFSYRYSGKDNANILIAFSINQLEDLNNVILDLESGVEDCQVIDISNNELAKTHLRFFSGGRGTKKPDNLKELTFRFEFPERPGALKLFLENLQSNWNISLFHYRNYGDDMGRVLAAIQIPYEDEDKLDTYLKNLGYPYIFENDNPLYEKFL